MTPADTRGGMDVTRTTLWVSRTGRCAGAGERASRRGLSKKGPPERSGVRLQLSSRCPPVPPPACFVGPGKRHSSPAGVRQDTGIPQPPTPPPTPGEPEQEPQAEGERGRLRPPSPTSNYSLIIHTPCPHAFVSHYLLNTVTNISLFSTSIL